MGEKLSIPNQDNQANVINEKLHLITEIANKKDWKDYKKIRLEAIENEPMAFYVTKESKEDENNKSDKKWKDDLTDLNIITALSKNENIPVGMVQSILKNKNEEKWHIRGVYLNKNFRGKGFGKETMNSILDEIKKRGGKKVTLNVVDSQEIAKKIYEQLGFKLSERFEPEIIDGIEYPGGQWMEKEI